MTDEILGIDLGTTNSEIAIYRNGRPDVLGDEQGGVILPSVVGIGLFGFTLSWDELARSSQAIGSVNTLPLELQGLTTTVTKPDIYALGTLTSAVSFLVIFTALIVILVLQARQRRQGSDAGKGMI